MTRLNEGGVPNVRPVPVAGGQHSGPSQALTEHRHEEQQAGKGVGLGGDASALAATPELTPEALAAHATEASPNFELDAEAVPELRDLDGPPLREPGHYPDRVTLAEGDTFESIAAKLFGGDSSRAAELAAFNGLEPDASLEGGSQLKLPPEWHAALAEQDLGALVFDPVKPDGLDANQELAGRSWDEDVLDRLARAVALLPGNERAHLALKASEATFASKWGVEHLDAYRKSRAEAQQGVQQVAVPTGGGSGAHFAM